MRTSKRKMAVNKLILSLCCILQFLFLQTCENAKYFFLLSPDVFETFLFVGAAKNLAHFSDFLNVASTSKLPLQTSKLQGDNVTATVNKSDIHLRSIMHKELFSHFRNRTSQNDVVVQAKAYSGRTEGDTSASGNPEESIGENVLNTTIGKTYETSSSDGGYNDEKKPFLIRTSVHSKPVPPIRAESLEVLNLSDVQELNGSDYAIKTNQVADNSVQKPVAVLPDVTNASGSLVAASGSLVAASGSLVAASGSLVAASGGLVVASGSPVAASGGLVVASGSPVAASGSPVAASGGLDAAIGGLDAAIGGLDAASGSLGAGSGADRSALDSACSGLVSVFNDLVATSQSRDRIHVIADTLRLMIHILQSASNTSEHKLPREYASSSNVAVTASSESSVPAFMEGARYDGIAIDIGEAGYDGRAGRDAGASNHEEAHGNTKPINEDELSFYRLPEFDSIGTCSETFSATIHQSRYQTMKRLIKKCKCYIAVISVMVGMAVFVGVLMAYLSQENLHLLQSELPFKANNFRH